MATPLSVALDAPVGDRPRLHWLGQAGFVLDLPGTPQQRVVIDPYLSDHLARKYAGTRFPHDRLAAAPIDASDLRGVALLLISHHHSDHMDPGSIPALVQANPDARFVIPARSIDIATERGVPIERLVAVAGTERIDPIPGVTVHVVPAAHEELDIDRAGRSRFVGYVIEAAGVRIYHSGDCIPYEGQADRLRELRVDVALLPVNGRDGDRRDNGVPGNFHLHEAIALCEAAEIPTMIAHHVGMFAFNTVDRDILDAAQKAHRGCVRWSVAQIGHPVELPCRTEDRRE